MPEQAKTVKVHRFTKQLTCCQLDNWWISKGKLFSNGKIFIFNELFKTKTFEASSKQARSQFESIYCILNK